MKKLGIVIYNLKIGGAERIVTYLLERWHDKIEIYLILINPDISFDIPKRVTVKIIRNSRTERFKLFAFLSDVYLIRKYLKENDIYLMLSFLIYCNLLSCLVKIIGWKGKLIISERVNTISFLSTQFNFYKGILFFIKIFYNCSNGVVAISKGVKNELEQLGVKNVTVIYNPSPNFKVFKEKTIKNSSKPFVILSVGRLHPEKNHRLILKSLVKLTSYNWKAIFIGDGPELTNLISFASELGLSERVEFLGEIIDVNQFYLQADLFILSSNMEAFGNVILEAMCFSVPIISTDCPSGPSEILNPKAISGNLKAGNICKGEFGVLSKVGDEISMASAIEMFLIDDNIVNYYSKQSTLRCKDFDLDKISSDYYTVLFEN